MVAEFVSSDESLACDEYEQAFEFAAECAEEQEEMELLRSDFELAFQEYYRRPMQRVSDDVFKATRYADRTLMVSDSQWNSLDWLGDQMESFADHSADQMFPEPDAYQEWIDQ